MNDTYLVAAEARLDNGEAFGKIGQPDMWKLGRDSAL
jgi:hypothetical protein